jgi:hypothetical protein
VGDSVERWIEHVGLERITRESRRSAKAFIANDETSRWIATGGTLVLFKYEI